MKVVSCEILKDENDDGHMIQVCVEFDEKLDYDNDIVMEKAGKVLLDYANNCDELKEDVEYHLKSPNNWYSREFLTEAFCTIECEEHENRDHWILE